MSSTTTAPRKFAHVGDVLFRGSVGRTDLPGGDHAALIRSIKEKLLPLGDDIGFICGHGPGGRFGEERRGNPYLVVSVKKKRRHCWRRRLRGATGGWRVSSRRRNAASPS